MQKRILTCAITGVLATRKQCPYIPYTPTEIAEETKRAFDAGATIAHIHARENDGRPSWRKEIFEAIKSEIEKRCPILINFSTGGVGNTIQERAKATVALRPHLAAVNMGSMNYAIWSRKEKKFHFEAVFQNPFSEIQWLLEELKKVGTVPELECFDAGQVCNADYFIEMALLRPPLHYSFIMGVCGGIKATRRCLENQISLLPPDSHFQTIGIGRIQWDLSRWALELGGDLRVGLEDNFYLPDGTMAQSNGELVTAGLELMRSMGYSPMNLADTRAAMGLGPD